MKLNCVVSGQRVELKINKRAKIWELIQGARNITGNVGNLEWEARTVDGKLLDNNTTVNNQRLVEDQTIYINPKVGVGGNCILKVA